MDHFIDAVNYYWDNPIGGGLRIALFIYLTKGALRILRLAFGRYLHFELSLLRKEIAQDVMEEIKKLNNGK